MEDNKTLPTTAEELQELIDKAVNSKVEELTNKHNDEMAKFRQKAKNEQELAVQRAVDNATLSAEEKAKKEQEEKFNALQQENAELKAKAHNGDIKDALTKSKLPLFLANDSRLVNATTSEELETAIELVKKDYTSSLPSGSQIDTNVVANKQTGSKKAEEDAELERFRNLGIRN